MSITVEAATHLVQVSKFLAAVQGTARILVQALQIADHAIIRAKEQILLAVLEVVQISPHHSTNAAVALPYP
ncbi:hypothetical protein N7478_006812 [Penicillium angulare]|uniref:uncharacterized protein n=1 Tax=Penicillium angulare TaxID=116970 RepID=UPI00253FE50F|nr:uncharacterized protein N7478_006812 [Penicillium angulare]KAJ5281440.1 hypothetical protein N7478_006812 [Penicillium angulare]